MLRKIYGPLFLLADGFPIPGFVRTYAVDIPIFPQESNDVLHGRLSQSQFNHQGRLRNGGIVPDQFEHSLLGKVQFIPHFIPHLHAVDKAESRFPLSAFLEVDHHL